MDRESTGRDARPDAGTAPETQRRLMQGHFTPAVFLHFPLPFTFSDGSSASADWSDAGACTVICAQDGTYIAQVPDGSCMAVTAFEAADGLYMAECGAASRKAVRVTGEEFMALTGRDIRTFTRSRHTICTIREAGADKEDVAILDITPGEIWFCAHTGPSPEIRSMERGEFCSICLAAELAEYFRDSDGQMQEMIYSAARTEHDAPKAMRMIRSFFGTYMHDIRRDLPELHFAKLFPGKARWGQTYLSKGFQILECRQMKVFEEMDTDRKEKLLENIPEDVRTGIISEFVLADQDGNILAMQPYGRTSYFAVTGREKGCIRLTEQGQRKMGSFCLSEQEFKSAYCRGRLTAEEFLALPTAGGAKPVQFDMAGYRMANNLSPEGMPDVINALKVDYDSDDVWLLSHETGLFAVPWQDYLLYGAAPA